VKLQAGGRQCGDEIDGWGTRNRPFAAAPDCPVIRLRTAQQLGMSRAALYDRLARWPELGHKGQDRPG
jgi:hypothetical protein